MTPIVKKRILLLTIIIIALIFFYDYGILNYGLISWNRVYDLDGNEQILKVSLRVWHLLLTITLIGLLTFIAKKVNKK